MTTHNHTAISTGAAANASTINTPLGAIDAAIGNLTTLGPTTKTSVVATIGTAALTTSTKTTLVAAINELVSAASGGATVSAQKLKEWTEAEAYEPTAITWDSDGVVTTATVKWPDGSAGTFTTTTKNATFLAIDAFTISHVDGSKTVTQSAVTRDSSGNVTVKPALTVA